MAWRVTCGWGRLRTRPTSSRRTDSSCRATRGGRAAYHGGCPAGGTVGDHLGACESRRSATGGVAPQTRRPGRPLTSTRRSSLMTDLDLGSERRLAGRSTRHADVHGALVLTPPAPVQVVEPEQAAGAVPVAGGRQAELQTRAASFAIELAALDVRSPEFAKKVESITALGDREMRESANVSSRMLERPAAAVNAAKGSGGNDAQTRVASTLSDLRLTDHRTGPQPRRSDRHQEGAEVDPGRQQDRQLLRQVPVGAEPPRRHRPGACLRQGRTRQGQRQHRGREGQHVDADGQARRVQRAGHRAGRGGRGSGQHPGELRAAPRTRTPCGPTRCSRSGSAGRTS